MLGPNVQLNNGEKCPQLGFGTFMTDDTPKTVRDAIDSGYRLVFYN